MGTEIDPRLQQLSYSSLLTLHSCPRRYELDKLTDTAEDFEPTDSNITFAFGHVVGEGVQAMFQGLTYEQAMWKMLLRWGTDLMAENPKQKKSFWEAVEAVRILYLQVDYWREEYELLYYTDHNGEQAPAVELSFMIEFPDGFRYRGFMDVGVRRRSNGMMTVIEVKTSSSKTIAEESYKNSAQALGYTVIMDTIAPGASAYEVVYVVYSSSSQEWNVLEFKKSMLQRARWIQQVMIDIETIKLFHESEHFPQHGESCYTFYRQCRYYGTCTLENRFVTQPLTPKIQEKIEKDATKFAIRLTLQDLIAGQVSRQQELTQPLIEEGDSNGKSISFDVL